jgi:hypothetical protein
MAITSSCSTQKVYGLLSLLPKRLKAGMRADVKGPHIPLVDTAEPDGIALASLVIIAARLSYAMRPVRLLLDSGANAPLLYNISRYIGPQISHDVPLRGSGVDSRLRCTTKGQ